MNAFSLAQREAEASAGPAAHLLSRARTLAASGRPDAARPLLAAVRRLGGDGDAADQLEAHLLMQVGRAAEAVSLLDGAIGRLQDAAPSAALHLARAQARLLADDARLGCTIGRHIVANYRRVRLFHAIAHPTAELIGRLAADLADKLGIDVGPAGLATYKDYMGDYQVPLHPRVIRSLGLAWIDEGTRYNFHNGEHLTFEDYYRRYIAVPVEA